LGAWNAWGARGAVLDLDLVGHFLDSGRTHAIEQLHHIAVERFSICAKEKL
jgi:hypothetical protein